MLPDGNSEVVKALAEHGLVIDLLCPEIERLVKTAILLQAPVASDLRFLLCVLRILPELERSHHLVVQLASRANDIHSEDLSPRSRELVERMGDLASGMFRRAADSWYQRDPSAAAVLAERDNEMDELHASLIDEVSSGRMALAVTIEMTLMAPSTSVSATTPSTSPTKLSTLRDRAPATCGGGTRSVEELLILPGRADVEVRQLPSEPRTRVSAGLARAKVGVDAGDEELELT